MASSKPIFFDGPIEHFNRFIHPFRMSITGQSQSGIETGEQPKNN